MLEWNSNGVIVDCRDVDTANHWGGSRNAARKHSEGEAMKIYEENSKEMDEWPPKGSDVGKNFTLKKFLEIFHNIEWEIDKMQADPNFRSMTIGQGMERCSVHIINYMTTTSNHCSDDPWLVFTNR